MYAHAASGAQVVAQEFLSKINEAILFPLITLMMAIALLLFLYGAFEYVKGASSDGDRETGKRHLLWGTIGMLVMLSAMAILYVAAGTFGLDTELDDARDAGKAWNGGFFNFGGDGDDYGSYRAPSTMNELENESFTIPIDTSSQESENAPSTVFTVEAKMESALLSFHQSGQNASAELKAITSDDIVGNFYRVNSEYPSDYEAYENGELSLACAASGGNSVFSIEANNKMGRIFFCVR